MSIMSRTYHLQSLLILHYLTRNYHPYFTDMEIKDQTATFSLILGLGHIPMLEYLNFGLRYT